ncbi:MAG: hypothetical protein K5866_04120, partial [Treponema sp.]|nr:hypothetical protein [Treponema sp.]
TFYVEGIGPNEWASGQSDEDYSVALYTEIDGQDIEAENLGVDENGIYKFKIQEYSDGCNDNKDILLKVLLTDSVGCQYLYDEKYIPNGFKVLPSLYISSDDSKIYSFSIKAEELNERSTDAASLSYEKAYQMAWDDETVEAYNDKKTTYTYYDTTLAETVKCKYKYTSTEDISFDHILDAINKAQSSYYGIENYLTKGGKYFKDINYESFIYSFGGISGSNGSKFFDPTVGAKPLLEYSLYTDTSFDPITNLDEVDVSLMPVYTYGSTLIYGKPIVKTYTPFSTASTETYILTYDVVDKGGSGINTGTNSASFENVKVSDAEGNDITSEFDIEYYLISNNQYSYLSKNFTYRSTLSSGGQYTVVVKAIKKDDPSIVISEAKTCDKTVVDTFPPEFTYDNRYERTFYDIYGNGRLLRLPLIYDGLSNSTNSYKNVLSDIKSINSNFAVDSSITSENSQVKIPYDYFWVKCDSTLSDSDIVDKSNYVLRNVYASFSSKAPVLTETEVIKNSVKSGTSYFTWFIADEITKELVDKAESTDITDSTYQTTYENGLNVPFNIYVPADGLPEASYVLYVKIYDEVKNYVFFPMSYYHFERKTSKPEISNNSTNYTFDYELKNPIINGQEITSFDLDSCKTLGILEKIDTNEGSWEYDSVTSLTPSSASVSSTLTLDSNSSYRYHIYYYRVYEDNEVSSYYGYDITLRKNYFHTTSDYIYFNTAVSESTAYNLLETTNGVTVYGKGLVQTVYMPKSDDGEYVDYGDDIIAWESAANILNPVYFTTDVNNYSGYEAVPDNSSYRIIVHFAAADGNGETIISPLHTK